MSTVDPEVLYLILTKVAGKESFYGMDAGQPAPGQRAGTITHRQLGEVYERVTGNRSSARLKWDSPVSQLNALLSKCGLPALGIVFLPEGKTDVELALHDTICKVQATKWPLFSALKGLYGRKK